MRANVDEYRLYSCTATATAAAATARRIALWHKKRYPAAGQQPVLHDRNYRYQPQEPVVKQHYQEQAIHVPPAPPQRGPQREPGPRNADTHPSPAPQQNHPVDQEQRRKPHQEVAQPGQQAPKPAQKNAPQGKAASHEAARGQGPEKDREKDEDRAQERKK